MEGLSEAIAAIANLDDTEKTVVGGRKRYTTVATRTEIFRRYCPSGSIETSVTHDDNDRVVVRAIVRDQDERLRSSGYAEEVRSTRGVNSTSAIENCETSAVGRALANLGLHGGEYASADEMVVALSAQQQLEDSATPLHPPPPPPPIPDEQPIAARDWLAVSQELIEKLANVQNQVQLAKFQEENTADAAALSKNDSQRYAELVAAYNQKKQEV